MLLQHSRSEGLVGTRSSKHKGSRRAIAFRLGCTNVRRPHSPQKSVRLLPSTGPRSIERGRNDQVRVGLARSCASTGPRSIERGRTNTHTATVGGVMLQRGRAQLSAEGRSGGSGMGGKSSWLQRGRAQLSAEGNPEYVWVAAPTIASTGPRSIERGRGLERLEPSGGSCGASTGPRSIERGRSLFADCRLVHFFASTGPRSIERGRMR